MKADVLTRDAHAAAHAHPGVLRHDHSHDHGAHAHHASVPFSTAARRPVSSLLMSSALLRLAGALGLSALLWTAVAWALSGTP